MGHAFASLAYRPRENTMAKAERALLAQVLRRLGHEHRVWPVVATEIEFYLAGSDALTYQDELLHEINYALREAGINAHPVEKERSPEQYEIALHPMRDVVKLAEQTEQLKQIVARKAAEKGVIAIFSAKPFLDRAGNGLHIHVHAENNVGENLFLRHEDERYSAPLLYSIQGMLDTMHELMLLFAPSPHSYSRFAVGNNAPTHCCWGPNNRTVALRLPSKPMNHKHIEHRVSGADAEPMLAIAAVLIGMHYGLSREPIVDDPIYGEAHKPMYELQPLPTDFEQAVDLLRFSEMAQDYIDIELLENLIRRALLPESY